MKYLRIPFASNSSDSIPLSASNVVWNKKIRDKTLRPSAFIPETCNNAFCMNKMLTIINSNDIYDKLPLVTSIGISIKGV